MRIFFITLSLISLLIISPSCKKKVAEVTDIEVDTELVEDDDDWGLDDENGASKVDSTNQNKGDKKNPVFTDKSTDPKEDKAVVKPSSNVKTVNPAQAGKLMKYNVVISSLSQESGVKRLSNSLDKSGIGYFVVKSGGLYLFVVESSDSLESAIEARKKFLLKATVDKSRQQIWKDYEIEVTDAYILERR